MQAFATLIPRAPTPPGRRIFFGTQALRGPKRSAPQANLPDGSYSGTIDVVTTKGLPVSAQISAELANGVTAGPLDAVQVLKPTGGQTFVRVRAEL